MICPCGEILLGPSYQKYCSRSCGRKFRLLDSKIDRPCGNEECKLRIPNYKPSSVKYCSKSCEKLINRKKHSKIQQDKTRKERGWDDFRFEYYKNSFWSDSIQTINQLNLMNYISSSRSFVSWAELKKRFGKAVDTTTKSLISRKLLIAIKVHGKKTLFHLCPFAISLLQEHEREQEKLKQHQGTDHISPTGVSIPSISEQSAICDGGRSN